MQVSFQRRNFQLVYILCAILADSLKLIVPTIENGDELRIRVFLVNFFFFFVMFSAQNQVPQIIIGMGRVIYHIKDLPVVIRILKNFPKVEKNWFEIFEI